MKTIAELKSTMPQMGKVKWIGVRPRRKEELISLDRAEVSLEYGLDGDHYHKNGGSRMLTLIQEEDIDKVSSFLSYKVNPGQLRRNIVVSGINLSALHDATFRIGEVILQGTGYCHPCSRMEENLGPGGFNAMRGQGGITCRVVKAGAIGLNDEIELMEAGKSET